MLSVEVYFDVAAGSIGRALFETAAREVFAGEGLRTAAISYVIVNDATIQRLHRIYFEEDSATDVITFPLDPDAWEAEIYISLETARQQARQYGVTLREELARLAIHGFLHLCDYDDTSAPLRDRMKIAEEMYLRKMFDSAP